MTPQATKETEVNNDCLDIYTNFYAYAQDFFVLDNQHHYKADELALEVV